MDGFTAFISTAQAISYIFSIAKSLTELRNVLKHGRNFLHNERATVIHLQEIIGQLRPKDEAAADPNFKLILASIDSTVERLLALFKQQKLRQITILLTVHRAEIDESFATLERQKSTLILLLAAQTSTGIAALRTDNLPHSTQPFNMSEHLSSPSIESEGSQPDRSTSPNALENQSLNTMSREQLIAKVQMIQQQPVPRDATREQVMTRSRRQTRPDQLQAPTGPNSGAFPSTASIIEFQDPTQHQRASFPQSDGCRRHIWIDKCKDIIGRLLSGIAKTYDSYDVSGNQVQNHSSQIICHPHHSYKSVTCKGNTIGSYSRQHLGVDVNGIVPTI